MNELFDFLSTVGGLKRVKRTGWQVQGVKDGESVAEHTYRVTIMAMLMAKEFRLDSAKLVKMALIHDLAETITGDIVLEKGSKSIASKESKVAKEERAMKDIFANLKESEEFFELWKEYEHERSEEAKILKQIDKLEMAMQALEYERDNDPRKLDEFWINAEKYIKDERLLEFFRYLKGLREG